MDGNFIGWYVGFALPPRFEFDVPRMITMDLVLDALVMPDGEWKWEKEAEFERGLGLAPWTQPGKRRSGRRHIV